jgi:diguanylate cyclase (GGDEF)-like protein/PAS domain S-box-containing protein
MGRRAWRWFLAAAALLAVCYYAVPSPLVKVVVWGVAGLAPVVAILAGVRLHRPARPMAWLLLAVGQALFTVGDMIFYVNDLLLRHELPLPSVADGFYLASSAPLLVGLVLLLRARTPGRDWAGLLDGLMITVGMAMLSWVFLVEPYVLDGSLPLPELLTSVAYPLADVLMLAVVARLWFGQGHRNPAFYLLTIGTVALLVADTLYGLIQLNGTWRLISPVDVGWLVFYAGFGAAALHPSMREIDQPGEQHDGKVSRARFGVVLALATLMTPVIVAIQAARNHAVDSPSLLVGSTVLFVLALIRTSGLVTALDEMHRRQGETRLQRLVQNATDLIAICEADSTIRYLTPSVQRVLGWQPDDLVGSRLAELTHPDDHAALLFMLDQTIADGSTVVECRMRRSDGGWIVAETVSAVVEEGEVHGYVLTIRDVSGRKALEQQLTHQAFHDSLTGLANRALFLDRLGQTMQRRGRADNPVAVLLLDLDDFKDVNDSLGHGAGDELLCSVAGRLRELFRESDTVARLGGDEFAILVDDLTDAGQAAGLAERLLDTLRTPITLHGQQLVAKASIGIALANPDRAENAEDVLRNADVAMYLAKQQDAGGYAYFEPSMHDNLLRRLALTADLRDGLARHEITVHYQPIVELRTGRIVGVEALARWCHPQRGPIGPDEFIPLAEQTGLIGPLGRSVLQQACAQAVGWRRQFPTASLTMNVNLSVRQAQHPGIVAEVAETLASTGLPPSALILEITESVLSEDHQLLTERLWALKRLGIRLAVDDFGTGYSSLSRLRCFPIDSLKIPKPFIDGILQGPEESALARAIIDLSATLGLYVVAEGIEHRGQWEELTRLNCLLGQGYYFARPATGAEITVLLRGAHLGNPAAGPPREPAHPARAQPPPDGPSRQPATAVHGREPDPTQNQDAAL